MVSSPLLQAMLEILDGSDRIFMENWDKPRNITHKGLRDLVTDTDFAIEAYLKKEFGNLLPGSVFMAEESNTLTHPEGTCWIIDPVDGTTNFAHHFGDTCTSVALWKGGRVQSAVVSAPVRGERYVAEYGKGAWLNGSPLHVTEVPVCIEALVATGFPYAVSENMDAILDDMRILLGTTVGVRRCGSAALDLCFVAAGSFDAYFERWIRPWDVAAGWLIVEEAGGRVSGIDGAAYRFNEPILASNSRIHAEMLRNLQQGKAQE